MFSLFIIVLTYNVLSVLWNFQLCSLCFLEFSTMFCLFCGIFNNVLFVLWNSHLCSFCFVEFHLSSVCFVEFSTMFFLFCGISSVFFPFYGIFNFFLSVLWNVLSSVECSCVCFMF